MSELLDAARTLAERGYHVFPCRPRRKEPLTAHGFKDATRDERAILHAWERCPAANIGVACGASGIVVLDIDTKYGADPREVIGELELEGHPIIATGEAPERSERYPASLSGERGAQVFYRSSRRTVDSTSIPGVELCGIGAYVVVPPSAHPSGVQYLGELPPVDQLPPLPASVAQVLPDPARAGEPTPAHVWLSIIRDSVEPGRGTGCGRNKQLTRIFGHLLRRNIDVDLAAEVLHLIAEHRCRPPLPAVEVDRIIDSICNAELRRRQGAGR